MISESPTGPLVGADNEPMSAPMRHFHAPDRNPWSGRSIRAKLCLLFVLGLIQMVVTFTITPPGHLLPDETIYHWMVKSFAETGRLDIWNGHDEIASPELHYPLLVLHRGKLFPQYPFLFQLIAAPFYLTAGFFGLFLLNSMTFVAGTVLWFLAARRLFRDEDPALNAVLILVLATFAWEYSLGAWPHAASLCFVAGAFYCLVRAFYGKSTKEARSFAAMSGLIAGLAAGIRLDAFLIFPAVILPFLFAKPWRPVEAFAAGLALLPGLALLVGTNFLKFGTLSPVSYGGGGGTPGTPLLPAAIAGAVMVLTAWTLSRSRCVEYVRRHGLVTVVGLAGCALAAVIVFPKILVYLERFSYNAYVILADIRSFPSEVIVGRSSGGGVVYGGAHKKALLQSLPFLPLMIIPAAAWLRGEKDSSALALLLPIPICVTSFYCYSYLELHGGFCLNQRYLLFCLPFIAMLSAYGIRELNRMWSKPFGFSVAVAISLVTVAVYIVMTRVLYTSVDALEFPLLVVPLWIAGILLVLIVVSLSRLPSAARKFVGIGAVAVTVVALTWAGLVALSYDYPHHRQVRAIHHLVGKRLMEAIPTDSILFSDNKTNSACMALIEKKRVRLASAHLDGFRDVSRLADFHLAAGRRAFGFFHRSTWAALQAGPLKDYSVKILWDYSAFSLREITRHRGGS